PAPGAKGASPSRAPSLARHASLRSLRSVLSFSGGLRPAPGAGSRAIRLAAVFGAARRYGGCPKTFAPCGGVCARSFVFLGGCGQPPAPALARHASLRPFEQPAGMGAVERPSLGEGRCALGPLSF